MSAIVRHVRSVVAATAVIRAAAVVGRSAAVIARPTAVVTVAVIIVAPVLAGRDRDARADDAGKGRGCRGTTATAIIPATGADIGRAAGPGRCRYAVALRRRAG